MKKTPSKKTPPAAKTAPKKTAGKPTLSKSKPAANDFTELRSLQEIKELIEFVAARDFDEIELERGDFHLRLRRGGATSATETTVQMIPQMIAAPMAPVPAPVAAAPVVAAASPAPVETPAPAAADEGLHIITSPLVGTFYRAASPTAEPFAKVGDSISTGQTLCIVEAMKLMNEVQSDASGTIVKMFVENAQPVEYGQPLFGIKL